VTVSEGPSPVEKARLLKKGKTRGKHRAEKVKGTRLKEKLEEVREGRNPAVSVWSTRKIIRLMRIQNTPPGGQIKNVDHELGSDSKAFLKRENEKGQLQNHREAPI